MRLKIYFVLHFGIIFIVSLFAVINSFLDYKGVDREKLEVVNSNIKSIIHNPAYHLYTIFSGTNTGYGFYGINVSTYKYFTVELFNADGGLIKTVSTFGIKNKNNLSRFEVLAAKMANYIVDNKNYPEDGDQEILKIRKLYVNKIFKHIGLNEAEKTKGCKSYKTTLYTLMPDDIWEKDNYHVSKKIGVYESIEFNL